MAATIDSIALAGRPDALIKRLRAYAGLSPDDEVAVTNAMKDVRRLPPGADLVEKGDRPRYVHIILLGWAARYGILPDGSRAITAFLLPGDLCDLRATLIGEMDHSIQILTPAAVAYVPLDQWDLLMRTHPRLEQAFWSSALVDEAVLREWLVNLGRRDAFEAIGHLLCELHVRLGKAGLTDNAGFQLPITQEEIADSQGLTPVHVNRMLQRLRQEGYITLRAGRLIITNLARLEAVAGFDPSYLEGTPSNQLQLAAQAARASTH